MERWVKVVLGTLFASVGCFIFFLIYDRVMIYFRESLVNTSIAPSPIPLPFSYLIFKPH